jgi:PAS domain S-box-containing protein
MEFLSSLFGRGDFLPHGYCFTWSPGLLWTMVGSDAVIAVAYFSIPLAILRFTRQRGDVSTRGIAWLFSAFIFACGITHVMDIWTIWQPDYALQAFSKGVTAAVSIVTAFALWPLIPRALKIPSVAQLQAVIGSLEMEIQRRNTVEAQLAETQQSLAVTLASIGAGFIALDRAGHITRMNAVAERVTGWAADEAQGQSYWKVFSREGRPASMETSNPIDVLLELGVTIDNPQYVTAVARDGHRTALEVKVAPTHARDGSVRGAAMVFRDMTPAIEAEAQANRLSAIVESSNDAIISKTLDGRITSWNGAAQAMFGYSADEAIGQTILMLLPPDREAEEMRILADLARGERVPPFTTVRRARDGRLLDVSVSISPIRDGQGRIVGASKIARDVTQQRRAERALRDSEERLRFTLESAQIGDWDLDLSTGVMQRSARHDRCFGYAPYRGDWRLETLLQHVHPDDRDHVERVLHDAVMALRDWQVECRVVWPDGGVHWISAHGSMRTLADQAMHMVGIVIDTTTQRLAEQARLTAQRLEAENRQIQDANRLKSQFLANMSHELRTPLNAIIGFAELMHSGAVRPDSPKHHDFLGHIASSGHHLLQLINDVLDLSKVESGKFEFFPEPVDLTQLVREVTDVLRSGAQHKRIQLGTDIDSALGELQLDPARLRQVLYNYLSNAIKFTPEGGQVTVRARPHGPLHFRLEVEDNGIGIAPADLPRLFVEFQQLDAGHSKQHQGTGLGLVLTRRLVEGQGGRVGVRSEPGSGSVFHLVLARNPAATPGPAPQALTLDGRLLVIEDDAHEHLRIARPLREAGFSVDAAATGKEALALASHVAYAAITLDLLLPDQQGLGVLDRIRRDGPSQGAPVLGVSMAAEPDKPARFSIADVLGKPIRTQEIVTAMARLHMPHAGRPRVMVVDDDPLALDLMRATLADIGIDALCLAGGREALRELDNLRPDAIILDLMMPEFDGFEVLDALLGLPAWRDTPVFIWTSMLLTDAEYTSLARSARAIVSKGGGALPALLDGLRRWRPPLAELPDGAV